MIEPGKNGRRSGSVAKGRCEASCFVTNGRPLVRWILVRWSGHRRVAQASPSGHLRNVSSGHCPQPIREAARQSIVVPGTQHPDGESLHGPSLGRIIYLNESEVHVFDPRSKRPEQLAELLVVIQALSRRESSTLHGNPLGKGGGRGFPRTSRWPGNVLTDPRTEVVGPRCGYTDVQVPLPEFAEQVDPGYSRDLPPLGRIDGRACQKLTNATSKEVGMVFDFIVHGQ